MPRKMLKKPANLRKRKLANKKITPSKIGVLGPSYTFTDCAADLYIEKELKRAVSKELFCSVRDLFEALKNREIDLCVVPIENTIHGTVRESLDALFKSDACIVCQFSLPIHHCLAVKHGTKSSDIAKIISHHQAINQCREYLHKEWPSAQLISYSSTSEAIHDCLADSNNNKGVICSKKAAEKYSLDIIKERIEDRKDNKTWFGVIENREHREDRESREHCEHRASKNIQTSVAFYFQKDKPGTLFGVFKDFADAKVNMTRIESRPASEEMGGYVFFLDFEGNAEDEKIKKLLKEVSKKVAELKNFGSYPRISFM